MQKDFWTSVEGLLGNAEEFARDSFAVSGEVLPMFIAVGDPGLMVISTPWTCSEDKMIMWHALRDKFLAMNVQRYAFLAEAWMAKVSDAEEMANVRASEHPQRQEVVQVLAVDRTGKVRAATMPILRNGDKAWLGETVHANPNEHQSGLMTTLLDDTRRAN